MQYLDRLRKVAVLGAAGKMGSGILFLTAMEMTEQKLRNPDFNGKLYAIDVSADGLDGLLAYIGAQALRAAEKKAVMLRGLYANRSDLIENEEVIQQYIKDVLASIRTSTHLSDAYGASLVFEAIKEDPKLKQSILSDIDLNSPEKPWYFTNTSSIPIGELDDAAQLDGRLIGFHFYNPPAVQKLVELIPGEKTQKELIDFAMSFAKSLRKVVVPSNDFAGFIGNGHFMRDAQYAIREAESLSNEMGLTQAIVVMNTLSQNFLLRPMGIFQLIDYVGIDVVSYIMGVMNPYLPAEELNVPLLDELIGLEVRGGQFPDGSQKDGFFQYKKGRLTAVYDMESQTYLPIEPLLDEAQKFLGDLPEKLAWKEVNFSPKKAAVLDAFFKKMSQGESKGYQMAKCYGQRSMEIGNLLVASGVAKDKGDVNKVLMTGFYHAYGPINNYFN